ncbi:MAG: hypothetical protein WKG00_20410 [Polyangiaceae bacterium]
MSKSGGTQAPPPAVPLLLVVKAPPTPPVALPPPAPPTFVDVPVLAPVPEGELFSPASEAEHPVAAPPPVSSSKESETNRSGVRPTMTTGYESRCRRREQKLGEVA